MDRGIAERSPIVAALCGNHNPPAPHGSCSILPEKTTERGFTAATGRDLEHDPEKWKPVLRKDHAQSKRLDHDAIPSNRVMI
jgi:hypothetical protein